MHADNQNPTAKASPDTGVSRAGVFPNQESHGHVTGSFTAAAASSEVQPPKWFARSKTIWGAIVGLLPHVLSACGLEFDDGEIQSLATAGTSLLAAILVVWGRATVRQPVALKPQKPSEFVGSAVIVGAIVSLSFSGCATTVRDASGVTRFKTYGNAAEVMFRTSDTSLVLRDVNHSEAIRAGTNGTTSIITAAGAAAASGGLK